MFFFQARRLHWPCDVTHESTKDWVIVSPHLHPDLQAATAVMLSPCSLAMCSCACRIELPRYKRNLRSAWQNGRTSSRHGRPLGTNFKQPFNNLTLKWH
jgi:hypothetical protein